MSIQPLRAAGAMTENSDGITTYLCALYITALCIESYYLGTDIIVVATFCDHISCPERVNVVSPSLSASTGPNLARRWYSGCLCNRSFAGSVSSVPARYIGYRNADQPHASTAQIGGWTEILTPIACRSFAVRRPSCVLSWQSHCCTSAGDVLVHYRKVDTGHDFSPCMVASDKGPVLYRSVGVMYGQYAVHMG